MSDSASSFSELKDNESSGASTSIPINTSLTHADKPLPTTVEKPASTKATFTDDYSTLFVPAPHPSFTVDWFTHYLKQTRVLIILALLIYTLVLVIWIATLGKASKIAAASSGGVICPQWSNAELVPAVVNTCPPARAEVYHAGSTSAQGGVRINGNSVTQEDVSLPPMAIFLPNAATSYYYTAVFLDSDYTNRNAQSRQSQLRGVLTNLRLGESVDTNSGQWVMPYEAPSTTDNNAHRYVWLIYRHSTATSNLQGPVQVIGFNVEDWFASDWSQRPTLVGAAYFTASGR